MKIKRAILETVIGINNEIPKKNLIEFVFVGKSNVGKSSLINSLINCKNYAYVSSKPGKTKTINCYNIDGKYYLVDLPGYGYAKLSKEIKIKFGRLIEKYFNSSEMIINVFLLVDIRHKPSNNDILMYYWIVSHGYKPIIIATKLDKLNRSQIVKNINIIRNSFNMKNDDVLIPFSSKTKYGLKEIFHYIK